VKHSRFPLVVTLAVLAFLYLPILVLVAHSFNASRFGGGWGGFSLQWYAKLFRQGDIWHALQNTLLIAVGATGVSAVLGTTAAFALHRYSGRLQRVHYSLIYTPLVVPEILMGISLLLFFVALGVDLGLGTIFLAHVTFCISYVAMVVLARLQDFDFSVMEAARDLGADSWTATRRVLLPLLAPGIAAGSLLAFTLSIDDFVVSFFVAGPGATTLPIRIYSMIKHGSPPLINALSSLLLLVTFVAVGLSQRLTRRGGTGS
jgi:spermidine/putrescine transport system permease protein